MTAQLFRVAVFTLAMSLVYTLEVSWWIRRWRARRSGGPMPSARARAWAHVLHAVAAAGILCVLWGRFVEPFRVELREEGYERPAAAGVASGARFRIVHLSDLHIDGDGPRERDLAAQVASLRPDVIVITGDLLNTIEAAPVLRRIVGELKALCGVYVSPGNWDVDYVDSLPHAVAAGAVVLERSQMLLDTPVGKVQLVGLPEDGDADLDSLFGRAPEADWRVVLCHVPDAIDRAAAAGAHLYLCGHTHGGQVCVPGYGALITNSALDKKYESGRYAVGAMAAYVSRGLGMQGGHSPRVRFWCRPEITVHELRSSGGR